MELQLRDYYEVMSPRCTVLVTTVNPHGVPNAAPFSFTSPVSINPPLVFIASMATRDTMSNIRETGEFVLNMVPEALLEPMIVCGKPFARGVNEIIASGLNQRMSKVVQAPGIAEAFAWLECRFEFEREAGDHIMVVGRVVHVEAKDEVLSDGRLDMAHARPLLHVRGRRFVVAEKVVEAKTPD